MTVNHTHFEVLCALAASGQVTSMELAELHEHSKYCSSCSNRLIEMTQLSAQLFSAHALNQPGIRIPKDMLERFITRANSEGVPLNSRATSVALNGPTLTAVFLMVLLLVSATLHFGSLTESTGETGKGDVASVARSLSDGGGVSLGASKDVAPNGARASRTLSRKKASRNGHKTPLSVSQAIGHGRSFRLGSVDPDQTPFDLTVYSRNVTIFPPPFLLIGTPDQIIQWSPTRFGMPKLHFAGPLEFVKNDPPRLLAECEHRPFAPWSPQGNLVPGPGDVQVLRREFDPDAYSTLLNPDFKRNLPAFQFARNGVR